MEGVGHCLEGVESLSGRCGEDIWRVWECFVEGDSNLFWNVWGGFLGVCTGCLEGVRGCLKEGKAIWRVWVGCLYGMGRLYIMYGKAGLRVWEGCLKDMDRLSGDWGCCLLGGRASLECMQKLSRWSWKAI